jgi:hypothetical protein
MKLIATTSFSQGLNNPLGLPSDSRHVEKGTVFSIGGDLPFEKLSKEQQMLFGKIAHCTCPLDTEQGRQILAEVNRLQKSEATLPQKSETENVKSEKPANNSGDNWRNKIFIGVCIGLIVLFVGAVLHHFFPNWFH